MLQCHRSVQYILIANNNEWKFTENTPLHILYSFLYYLSKLHHTPQLRMFCLSQNKYSTYRSKYSCVTMMWNRRLSTCILSNINTPNIRNFYPHEQAIKTMDNVCFGHGSSLEDRFMSSRRWSKNERAFQKINNVSGDINKRADSV